MHHKTYFCVFYRLQRGDGRVQEHQFHSVGRGRSGQDPAPVAALLPEHSGAHLRRRLQRQRAGQRVQRGTTQNGKGQPEVLFQHRLILSLQF